ncbi:MAG: serine/threonine-protein kinase [Planctomycetota bacterium]
MGTTGHAELRRLFDLAAEASPSERSQLLDEQGVSGETRKRVLAMIAASEGDGFLDEATVDASPERSRRASESPGEQIDRYKLLQPIGEGGFGTVWMAEQKEPVKRRVALKIIKLGMDTKQVIARFEAERQALAMMDHPNIAKVLDAGATETGRPYFVMEYIRGVPLLEYCDTEKLDTSARLDLFILICKAIQHAHQKGVIHRDIKPSNVLVTLHDGVAVPKVIDFGIAKATNQELTEKTLFTEHRQMIGTPAYMSPEQAEMSGLDVDTRSDIYSLGVLLYELLTGTTPFTREELASAGFDGMMRIIREIEPKKPSTRLATLGKTATRTADQRRTDAQKLGTLLRGDLDWIVMKCLEKDRTRRYDTATGLASDIDRHLSDRPVLAGPPSAGYQLRKFVRRNRGRVLAAAAFACTLMVGLAGVIVMYLEAENARQDATTQFLEAKLAREDADALNEYFIEVFGNIGWVDVASGSSVGMTELSAKGVVDRALEFVDVSLEGRPMLEAKARNALASSALALGDYETTRRQFEVILKLYSEAGLADDDYRVLLAKGMALVGIVAQDPSEDDLAEAMELERRIAAQIEPCGPGLSLSESIAHHLSELDRHDEAIGLMELRLHGCEFGGVSPTEASYLAILKSGLASFYTDAGMYSQAAALLEEVLASSARGVGGGYALLEMGNLRTRHGYPGDGIPDFSEGLEMYRTSLGDDHPYTRGWESGFPLALLYEGYVNDARRAGEEHLAKMLGRAEAPPEEIARARSRLVFIALASGDVDEAERQATAIEQGAAALPDDTPAEIRFFLDVDSMIDRAILDRVAGDVESVMSVAQDGLALIEGKPETRFNEIMYLRELGYANAMAGRTDEATEWLGRAKATAAAHYGSSAIWPRWIELDLEALVTGTLDPTRWLQQGWIDLVQADH